MYDLQPPEIQALHLHNLVRAVRCRGRGRDLKSKLGIDWNETTPDGRFTLKEGECFAPAATLL